MDGKSINIDEIYVQARAGSTINDCIRDSLILAITEGTTARLTHNSKKYTIVCQDVLDVVGYDSA